MLKYMLCTSATILAMCFSQSALAQSGFTLDPAKDGVVEFQADTSKQTIDGWWMGPYSLENLTDFVEKDLTEKMIKLYGSDGRETVWYEIQKTIFKDFPDVIITAIPKRVESHMLYDHGRDETGLTWFQLILDERGIEFTLARSMHKDSYIETKMHTTVTIIAYTDKVAGCGSELSECDFSGTNRLDILQKVMDSMRNKKPLRMKGSLIYSDYFD